jgi:hypothetical protein
MRMRKNLRHDNNNVNKDSNTKIYALLAHVMLLFLLICQYNHQLLLKRLQIETFPQVFPNLVFD